MQSSRVQVNKSASLGFTTRAEEEEEYSSGGGELGFVQLEKQPVNMTQHEFVDPAAQVLKSSAKAKRFQVE